MGSGPALALLLLAALGTLHSCSPLAAAGGTPTLGAVDINLGQSARRLLEAISVTAGNLDCDQASYVAPLTIDTPGLYKFRIKALGTNTNSAGRGILLLFDISLCRSSVSTQLRASCTRRVLAATDAVSKLQPIPPLLPFRHHV